MAFIRRVKTKSGATAIQIAHKRHGHIVRIEHIGSGHNNKEVAVLTHLARKRLHQDQLPLFTQADASLNVLLKSSVSSLLYTVLIEQYGRLGFDAVQDRMFALLCAARIVEPVSKIDSLRVLNELGVEDIDKNHLYRCLKRVVKDDYRQKISERCLTHAKHTGGLTLILYDVTTLYFEVHRDDNYRKAGLSKERRLEPQIVIGLLVDAGGFPLGVHSFEGNVAETKTMLPVIEDFCLRHTVERVTVITDAAMLSAANLIALEGAGHRYIVGSRLNKVPYDIADYQKEKELSDGQIIETVVKGRRIIYQYREQRAKLDRENIQKQIDKARRIIVGKRAISKTKFLKVTAKTKTLNQTLIGKAYALVGIKGYVTNMDIAGQKVIDYYHELFKVEASFRMAKSDLKARPIFHRKRDAIEAHLTVVFAAMAVGKSLERKTGISVKQLVKILRPVRSGIIVVNGYEYEAQEYITPVIHKLLEKLRSGH